VTGVFCQTAIESANLDQEMATQAQLASKQEYIKRFHKLFQRLNANHTGLITLQELQDGLQDEKMHAYFASMDLSVDEAFHLFKLLDSHEEHVLDTETFVTGCLRLRGHAKSIDIATMMYENRWNLQKCLGALRSLEDMVRAGRSSHKTSSTRKNNGASKSSRSTCLRPMDCDDSDREDSLSI